MDAVSQSFVETAADIMQELGPIASELQIELQQMLDRPAEEDTTEKNKHNLLDDSDYGAVWEVLGYDPKPMDVIIEQTGLSAREISSMLLMMELEGLVKKQGAGRYVRV